MSKTMSFSKQVATVLGSILLGTSLIHSAAEAVPKQQKEPMIKVGSLRELQGDNTCQGTGGIMTYAETKNFRVYICADKRDRTQPRYYRSRNRNGKGGLNLEAKNYNPRQMRYFEFTNQGHTYTLQIPTSQIPRPVLSIGLPNGKYIEEPVLRYLSKN